MASAHQQSERAADSDVRRFSRAFVLFLLAAISVGRLTFCQADTASVSGVITDQSGGVVVGAEVRVTNTDTNVTAIGASNGSGIYLVTALKPGRYRIHVGKEGFRGIDLTDLILNIQDSVSRNFTLHLGSTAETVSVEGNVPQINTQDASVSTFIDRQFAENLPMNGRSFQTLIQLTPGVVAIPSTSADNGQFSVNGQRGESNYWTVDGVSANIGMSASSGGTGNSFGGAIGSFSALGGTNSLVSVDALQEFRIQTSTYAPEFGRTPGGQISIVTRSGANQFHGTLFEYLRNDVLDANDWFANEKGLPKARERQNDFGGTFNGPIFKDKTFFFFSYEGLRLRLPQTTLTTVPDLNARLNAVPGMQPFLNAFPSPNGPEDSAHAGAAQFNASYSNPATLDAYSLRIDHRLTDKLSFFARYNYSPSELVTRGGGGLALSTISPSRIKTQTATLGNTWSLSAAITNDFRFNYSRTNASSRLDQDNFGGAVPLNSLGFPSPFTSENASLGLSFISLSSSGTAGSLMAAGQGARNLQSQLNVVDNLSLQKNSHSLKFGIDFRRLSPRSDPIIYQQFAAFLSVPSAEAGNPFFSRVLSGRSTALLFKNLGVFAQDTWRTRPRLSVTYGLRWDVDFDPSSSGGPNLAAVTGYNLQDLSNLALAPAGTSPFETRYGNIAPRLGLAYQVSQIQEWQTVCRAGFGVFYDLVTSQTGNAFGISSYPFGGASSSLGGSFPLAPALAAPPQIVPPNASNGETLFAFDPHVRLPYTLEWNVAVEQSLGKQQTISASYIGSAGRRLLQTADILTPNPNLGETQLVGNTATSDYGALQLQFNRRLSNGLQALASYTWSHSIDDGSAGSFENPSNKLSPTLNPNANRGPSDFDIRNAFSAAITYDIPALKMNTFARAILNGWSLQNIIQARSALPVDVTDDALMQQLSQGLGTATIRPDVVPGQPLYLFGSQCAAVLGSSCAGGKGFNPAAFMDPPIDPVTMLPTRQGNLGRNALRGFGATQWDFGVHRKFPIRESLKLEFRAEMFNVLNHPNFGPPSGLFGAGGFGLSTEMLGQYFNGGTSGSGNIGGGAFSPLYQIGGPRSIQFALKLLF
jgi:hypothetical protein